ncbi:MAG: hypothetical protein GWN84_13975, partial [Gammaproteobacteria bacterium]|nr:hypothetical protein [Gammaproteobacteria bacterium]NIR83914.1 hypothetical protein [Gammaproteobacteria bacterium]NIU05206.1 hypothetical protein [Gammaproteobacteria bacterium]NIV52062.1 hypothetical protein [Gammaproteobacteria bacterium]NIX86479.1 hypothetical protein [Gammaproteobacteria bacterium]
MLIGALATFGGVSVGSWKLVIQPDLKRMAPAKVVERTEALEEAVTGCVDEDPDCTDEQKA